MSRATDAASRSLSNRSEYTSSVAAAGACPSMCCTALTFAPALIAKLAAVCLSS